MVYDVSTMFITDPSSSLRLQSTNGMQFTQQEMPVAE